MVPVIVITISLADILMTNFLPRSLRDDDAFIPCHCDDFALLLVCEAGFTSGALVPCLRLVNLHGLAVMTILLRVFSTCFVEVVWSQ